jgi:hypothetical protein
LLPTVARQGDKIICQISHEKSLEEELAKPNIDSAEQRFQEEDRRLPKALWGQLRGGVSSPQN